MAKTQVRNRGLLNGEVVINSRQSAMQKTSQREPVRSALDYNQHPLSEIFGTSVFNRQVMSTVLPKTVFKAFVKAMDNGESLDPALADVIANAMKDWAIARGATHFTHWFQPMTGFTAEKHDSFLVSSGIEGNAIVEFSGKVLLQGEPDASSFPSGGIRSTFEARGYTGWDPTSPAFIMESVNGKTLCIPTVFCSFSGHALDKKTPLLRSVEAINKQAVRLLKLVGSNAKRIITTVGPEQEYFLIDEAFALQRPDLINAGRALFGAKPPKGQEMEDHYWGSIKERVLSFMMDAEQELYKLGVPVKTRHNEVAPAQFEVAPVFEDSNLAIDHNMLLMEVFKKTAQKHGMRCLFHEKPFSGVNGSGKHNNWSLADNEGNNLLDPGTTPMENMVFLVFLTATIRAISKWGSLLRATIASAGNDHRLGANEAPPAIMSIYLGDRLIQVVESIVSGQPIKDGQSRTIQIGLAALPELPRDDSDRNRTSPFAFTGNKFEFRAVGSSQSIAWPNTALNTMAAESIDYVATKLEEELKKNKNDVPAAVQAVCKEVLGENKKIIFNGDNYSAEWHAEAEKRGLPNLKNSVEALPVLVQKETKELFAKYKVLTEDELVSRYNVQLEAYCKTVNIEALLTASIATTMIVPAALQYQLKIATTIVQTREAGVSGLDLSGHEKLLRDVTDRVSKLRAAIEKLDALSHEVDEGETDPLHHAKFYQQKVIPAMNATRQIADELELLCDDSLWPLPKFREMLYIY
jgi:glutamine synthetase